MGGRGGGRWGRRVKLPEIVKMTSETVINKRCAHCLGGWHNAYLKLYPGDIISFSSKISIRWRTSHFCDERPVMFDFS